MLPVVINSELYFDAILASSKAGTWRRFYNNRHETIASRQNKNTLSSYVSALVGERFMKIRNILLGVALLATGSANAATVFAPTDGDVNFLLGDLLGSQLAIFDDEDLIWVHHSV